MLFLLSKLDFLLPLVDAIFPPRKTALLVRQTNLNALLARQRVRFYTAAGLICASSFHYRDPLSEAFILEAKFHKNRKAHKLLGCALLQSISLLVSRGFLDSDDSTCDIVLVPVPLSKRRRRERGYNQCEEIVRYTGIRADLSVLRRIRHTKPQTSLGGKERRRNVYEAFAASPVHADTLYVLVDDVCSTGATFSAAEQALRAAGARYVYTISLAH